MYFYGRGWCLKFYTILWRYLKPKLFCFHCYVVVWHIPNLMEGEFGVPSQFCDCTNLISRCWIVCIISQLFTLCTKRYFRNFSVFHPNFGTLQDHPVLSAHKNPFGHRIMSHYLIFDSHWDMDSCMFMCFCCVCPPNPTLILYRYIFDEPPALFRVSACNVLQ